MSVLLDVTQSDAQLNVYIADDGAIYKDDVYETAKKNRLNKDFQSLLILVSIKLGTNNLNSVYNEALKVGFFFSLSPSKEMKDVIIY